MSEQNNITLVLADINKDITLLEFVEIFSKHGEIMGVKITKRPVEDRVIHVGFVTFEDAEVARKYMADNNNTIKLKGQDVEIAFAKRGKLRRNDAYSKAGFHRTKLHVSGLPNDFSVEDVTELLGKCEVTMPKDRRGFCFATFESEQDKNEAVVKHNGATLKDDHKLVLAPAFIGGARNGDRKGGYRGKPDFGRRGDERKEQVMN